MLQVAANPSLTGPGRSTQKNAATSFPATSNAQLVVAHAPGPIGGKRRGGPAPYARPRENLLCRSNPAQADNLEEDRSRTDCWLRLVKRLRECHKRVPLAQHSRTAHMLKGI